MFYFLFLLKRELKSHFLHDCRSVMASWTPRYSTLLSQMLDINFGTQDMVETRQDYCKLDDCISSTALPINRYYTGSKAEGLDLPGSDMDFMYEINSTYNI